MLSCERRKMTNIILCIQHYLFSVLQNDSPKRFKNAGKNKVITRRQPRSKHKHWLLSYTRCLHYTLTKLTTCGRISLTQAFQSKSHAQDYHLKTLNRVWISEKLEIFSFKTFESGDFLLINKLMQFISRSGCEKESYLTKIFR